jgi:hypothetical protein
MEAHVKRCLRSHSLLLGLACLLGSVAASCSLDVRVDQKCTAEVTTDCNPGVAAPAVLIRGTISYIGPGPCILDGKIEGVAVALVFDAANPPPPDGLATTALNFATVPGERLFASVPRPSSGPGSPGNPSSYCPPLDGPPVSAATTFTVTELRAGNYQVRGFYSRENRFNPIFDFANLPLAGDTGGGVLVDPRAASPKFATITVGVKDASGKLVMPASGFVADGQPMILAQLLTTSRPFFYIDYEGSRGFTSSKAPAPGNVPYPNDDPVSGKGVGITFPQDHPLTAEPTFTATPPDLFKTAQASFPSIHFKYGFPGDATKSDATPVDAWLAKNAKPSDPYIADRVRPYYGIDPLAALTKEAGSFTLTRAFTSTGEPALLHDNSNLETFKFAQLFPLVVLAKLKDGPDGYPLDPPTPQTDPVVVLQGITLRNNSMSATSGYIDGTGLSSDKVKTTDEDLLADFTTLVRTAALCIDPTKGLQGTLTAPYFVDFNPKTPASNKQLVEEALVLKYQSQQVKEVVKGCLPPGWYSVNVVYPTGQAWGVPNQMGACVYGANGKLAETCKADVSSISADQASKGFDSNSTGRPLLASQQVYTTDPSGKRIPQVVLITPSERCMTKSDAGGKTIWKNKAVHEDDNGNGVLDAGEDKDGDGILSLRIPTACLPKAKANPTDPDYVQPK